jgi:hypothetical protein
MPGEVTSGEILPVAGDARGDRARRGLTSAPAALLALFDRIEQAVADDRRNATFSALPRRLRIVKR